MVTIMAKNRYKNSLRSFVGEMKVLSTGNPFLKKVEIWALNDRVTRNGWRYINLSEHLLKFRNIPLLTAYLPTGKIGDGHNYDMKTDPRTGEKYASFTAADAERIVGWVPESASVRLVEKDGVTWVVVEGNLWTWYARELVSQIVRQGNDDPMDVSIETLISDEYIEDGVAVETEYEVLGITILGRGVNPAVAGATIKSLAELSAIRDSMSDKCVKAASYQESNSKNNTKGVKELDYFSKRQLAELEPCFEGYQVLSAARAEDKIHVCLMKDGAAYTYCMAELTETIVPKRITAVNAMVQINCNGVQMEMTSELFTDALNAERVRANNAKEAAEQTAKDLQEELDKANETIKNMQEAENKRRVNAAKAAAKSALESFNANRAVPVEEKVLESINEDIDAGKYTEMCEGGDWKGDEAVTEKVLAACAKEQMRVDKQLSDKNKSSFIWDALPKNNGGTDDDPIRSALAAAGIE